MFDLAKTMIEYQRFKLLVEIELAEVGNTYFHFLGIWCDDLG